MKLIWATTLVFLSLATFWSSSAEAQQYRLNPGDVLRIEVIEDPSLNRDVLISPDGGISVPLAGTITAGGQTIEQVRSTLTAALAENFAASPNVFVGLSSLAEQEAPIAEGPEAEPITYDIFMLGEVGNTGLIQVEPGTNILQVFAIAGGFSDFAATKRIQLRRENGQIYPLNYQAIERGQSRNGQVTVADGDTFIVPTRRLFE